MEVGRFKKKKLIAGILVGMLALGLLAGCGGGSSSSSSGASGKDSLMPEAHPAAVNLLEGKPVNEGTDFEFAEDNEHIAWVPFEPVTEDNYTDHQ